MGNNPTLDALTELAELRLALRATGQDEAAKMTGLKIVVSCGTGPYTNMYDSNKKRTRTPCFQIICKCQSHQLICW